jgi:hypothetical protein
MTVATGQDSKHLVAITGEGIAFVLDRETEARDVELHLLEKAGVGDSTPGIGVSRNRNGGEVCG